MSNENKNPNMLAQRRPGQPGQQQGRPPPALMKMAAMIWKKSATRPQGQLTKQQAIQVAAKIWRQRQMQGQNPMTGQQMPPGAQRGRGMAPGMAPGMGRGGMPPGAAGRGMAPGSAGRGRGMMNPGMMNPGMMTPQMQAQM